MKKSKYLNFKSGNWTCTHVGVSYVQAKNYKGTKEKTLRPGHQSYYYIFERVTSDGKAEKLIRLNKNLAAKVYRGDIGVEEIVAERKKGKKAKFTNKISYHFIDRA